MAQHSVGGRRGGGGGGGAPGTLRGVVCRHEALRGAAVEPEVGARREVGDDGREVHGVHEAPADAALEHADRHVLHQRVHRDHEVGVVLRKPARGLTSPHSLGRWELLRPNGCGCVVMHTCMEQASSGKENRLLWQLVLPPTTRAPDVCGMHMHAHMLDMLRVLSSWTYVRVPDSHGDVDDISDVQDRTQHSSCAGVHAGA